MCVQCGDGRNDGNRKSDGEQGDAWAMVRAMADSTVSSRRFDCCAARVGRGAEIGDRLARCAAWEGVRLGKGSLAKRGPKAAPKPAGIGLLLAVPPFNYIKGFSGRFSYSLIIINI